MQRSYCFGQVPNQSFDFEFLRNFHKFIPLSTLINDTWRQHFLIPLPYGYMDDGSGTKIAADRYFHLFTSQRGIPL